MKKRRPFQGAGSVQQGSTSMKADKLIRNAKIFTSDREHPLVSALAVKDGKFVYKDNADNFKALNLNKGVQ